MRLVSTLSSLLLAAAAGPAPDNNTLPDVLDDCMLLPSLGSQRCDTDQDGYGNPCDGDDNSGSVNATDFRDFLLPDFGVGVGGRTGTDMDCSGAGGATDFGTYFLPQFAQGFPGPSGLPCAGTVPCP